MPWHQKTGADILLRVAGIGLLTLAWFAVTALRRRALAGSLDDDAIAYLLAMASFLCGSGSAVLSILGKHIFDRVEVARRWRRPDRE